MMRWTHTDIRRFLRLARRPRILENDRLGTLLCEAMGAINVRAALMKLMAETFDVGSSGEKLLYDSIRLCDFDGETTSAAASALHLSTRQFFRVRAAAIDAIAQSVSRALQIPNDPSVQHLHLAELLAEFDPAAALAMYERSGSPTIGRCAYDRAVAAMWAGANPERFIRTCSGPWRLLAQTALVRYLHANDLRDEAATLTNSVRREVAAYDGPLKDTAEFELAEIERRVALRRGLVVEATRLADRMRSIARSDSRLVALAQIANAEAALSNGDVATASASIADAERIGASSRDIGVLARAEYANAGVAVMQGDHLKAASLYQASAAALKGLDAGFALRACAYQGRTTLHVPAAWSPPKALPHARGSAWVNAELTSVRARYLLISNPAAAIAVGKKAVDIAQGADAPGALAYARATLGLALDRIGEASRARALLMEAFRSAIEIGDHMLLWDLFDHPAVVEREVGPLLLNRALVEIIQKHRESAAASAPTIPRAGRRHTFELLRLALAGACGLKSDPAESAACCRGAARAFLSWEWSPNELLQTARLGAHVESMAIQWLLPSSKRAAFRSAYRTQWDWLLNATIDAMGAVGVLESTPPLRQTPGSYAARNAS